MDYSDYSAPPPSYDSIINPPQRDSRAQAGGSHNAFSSSTSSSSSSTTASYLVATTISTPSTSAAYTPSNYPNEKASAYQRTYEPERDIQECIQTLETIAAESGRASRTTPASQMAPNSILTSLGYEPSEGSWYEVIQQFEHVVGICYDYHILGYGTLSITEPGLVWEGNLIQPKHSYGDFLEQDLKTFRFRFPSKLRGGGNAHNYNQNAPTSSSVFSTSMYSPTSTSSSSMYGVSSLNTFDSIGSSSSLYSSSITSGILGSSLKPPRTRRVQAATIKQVMPVVQSGAVALARVDKAFRSRLEWGGGGVLDDSEYDCPAKLTDLEKAAKDIREHLPSSSTEAMTSASTAPSAPPAPPLPPYGEINGSPSYHADIDFV
ncbi:hypothetical protein BGZ73_003154 [Actinomortierella ambigua]|nr:hypothetical protein BGZ73_003154 [Actinomortierella ambigua]